MKTAVLVIDMVKDNMELCPHDSVRVRGEAIAPQVNKLTKGARELGWPVIFATDSFLPGDGLFRGRMKDHSLRGTEGAEISGLLNVEPLDTWLPKRRMSAFYKTDLDQTLRLWQVERVAVCGLMTHYCVISTALDAICHDFAAVIVDDASNAHNDKAHEDCLSLYRKGPLEPLFTVQSVDLLLSGKGPMLKM